MKSFIAILALVAVAAADVSHIVHGTESDAQVVDHQADVFPDSFSYKYQTSNGIAAQESGSLQKSGPEDESIAVDGSYSYTAPNGEQIVVAYRSDLKGFQPQGNHLPTPPPPQPIPDYILRSLEYIAAHPPKPEPGQKY